MRDWGGKVVKVRWELPFPALGFNLGMILLYERGPMKGLDLGLLLSGKDRADERNSVLHIPCPARNRRIER